jgi:OCT family organic cation transporter-like MFS transporter 4/5
MIITEQARSNKFLLRYGRRFIFFATLALQTVFSILQAAANSWELFCALYFIVGMGQIANYCAAFILGE